MENNDSKVLIVIKGGVVQSIYSSSPTLKFDILDFDNEVLSTISEEEKILDKKITDLIPIL